MKRGRDVKSRKVKKHEKSRKVKTRKRSLKGGRTKRKSNNKIKVSGLKINLNGKNYTGRGNWIMTSPGNVYISFAGPNYSGRVYGMPSYYKKVKFDDKALKVKLTWSGQWWDEKKMKSKYAKKNFNIQFGKNKYYINFKKLFN